MGNWPKSNLGGSSTATDQVDSFDFNSLLEGAYNILAFSGVDPTGATDSTTGIASAISACAGRKLYVPPGIYLVTPVTANANTILIQGKTTIFGAGRRTVFKQNNSVITGVGTYMCFQFGGDDIELFNFEFDGNRSTVQSKMDSGTLTISGGSGTVGGVIGGFTVTVTWATSDSATATALAAAINADPNASRIVSAAAVGGVVTLTATSLVSVGTCTLSPTGTGVTASGATLTGGFSFQTYPFSRRVATGMDGLIVDRVWMHDVQSSNLNEAFGITLHIPGASSASSGQVTNVTYRNLRGWNVSGTPFHANGGINSVASDSWDTAYMTDGIEVSNVRCWNNDVQGISCYGAKNVKLSNSRFWGNKYNGINVEWSENVTISDCESFGNSHGGLNMDGPVQVVARDNHFHDNNTINNSGLAEIYSQSGQWWEQPLPRTHNGSFESHNNRVVPSGSNAHFGIARDSSVNFDSPLPKSIILNQPDIASWKIVGPSGSSVLAPCNLTHVSGPPTLGTVHLGRQSDWTAASLTLAAYTGGGNNSSDPIKLTGTTLNQRAYSSKGPLMPGRSYRIRWRIKAEDAVSTWDGLVVEHNGGTNQTVLWNYVPIAYDVGSWKTIDQIVTISSAWQPCHIQVNRADTGSSGTIDIDYVTVEEVDLGYNYSQRTYDQSVNAVTLTYSTSMTPDLVQGNKFFAVVPSGHQADVITINAPLNPVLRARIRFSIHNNTGGAITTPIAWDAVYKHATWTNPANQFRRIIDFEFDGANWVEQTQGVDIPL